MQNLFEGKVDRKLEQSLRGASKSSDKTTLLEKTHEARQQRERLRLLNRAATTIQSHVRSFIARKNMKLEWRKQFDLIVSQNPQTISPIIITFKLLNFCYDESLPSDHTRLITACKLYLSLINTPSFSDFNIYVKDNDCSFAQLYPKIIKLLAIEQSRHPILIRMLESLFENDETKTIFIANVCEKRQFISHITDIMVKQGYFAKLLKHLISVSHDSSSMKTAVTDSFMTPYEQSILQLIWKPLHNQLNYKNYINNEGNIWVYFMREILGNVSIYLPYKTLPFIIPYICAQIQNLSNSNHNNNNKTQYECLRRLALAHSSAHDNREGNDLLECLLSLHSTLVIWLACLACNQNISSSLLNPNTNSELTEIWNQYISVLANSLLSIYGMNHYSNNDISKTQNSSPFNTNNVGRDIYFHKYHIYNAEKRPLNESDETLYGIPWMSVIAHSLKHLLNHDIFIQMIMANTPSSNNPNGVLLRKILSIIWVEHVQLSFNNTIRNIENNGNNDIYKIAHFFSEYLTQNYTGSSENFEVLSISRATTPFQKLLFVALDDFTHHENTLTNPCHNNNKNKNSIYIQLSVLTCPQFWVQIWMTVIKPILNEKSVLIQYLTHSHDKSIEESTFEKNFPNNRKKNIACSRQLCEIFCSMFILRLRAMSDSELIESFFVLLGEHKNSSELLPEIIKSFKGLLQTLLRFLTPITASFLARKNCQTFCATRFPYLKLYVQICELLDYLCERNGRCHFIIRRKDQMMFQNMNAMNLWTLDKSNLTEYTAMLEEINVETFNENFNNQSADPVEIYIKAFERLSKKAITSKKQHQNNSNYNNKNNAILNEQGVFKESLMNIVLYPSIQILRLILVLQYGPFLLPFSVRVRAFKKLFLDFEHQLQTSSSLHAYRNNFEGLSSRMVTPEGLAIVVNIRRSHLYEDSFQKLSPINEPNLKLRLKINFIGFQGLNEAGIDGGGIFREFLNQLLRLGFDPLRGLFKEEQEQISPQERTNKPKIVVYPNPQVFNQVLYVNDDTQHLLITNPNHTFNSTTANSNEREILRHYFFLGRMLGKAIYENLLVEIPLSATFISKIMHELSLNLSKLNNNFNGNNSWLDMEELKELDPILYSNLMYLANYNSTPEMDSNEENSIANIFGLDFSVMEERFGLVKKIDLIPNGSNIPVTEDNRIFYIYLMVHYILNIKLNPLTKAFTQGVCDVIDGRWLYCFRSPSTELQTIVCGDRDKPIDIRDWKINTLYSGGYSESDPTILMFWDIVSHDFNEQKRSLLLKFVTSCGSPPLLGFKDLYPPFNIQRTSTVTLLDEDRIPTVENNPTSSRIPQTESMDVEETHTKDIDLLPTASTCMHLLKLPPYRNREFMKIKLLYAITSQSGFELS